ncbi:AI-2E family transporter [Microbacterium sp. KUDC0406]|uniref:AI-2E family transporter n=1 Tax=Microbacterium sp. KUDC0406 TaxID=2909588 RepID=UPI001F395359|nr:AI-2E family transporter [Microbacterium sp. KUDC0406]UJP09496.1 AI-2E family transporter [Microbacterium sp. KUDC0406]
MSSDEGGEDAAGTATGQVAPARAPRGVEGSRPRRILPAAPLRSGFLVAIGVLLAIALALVFVSLSSVLMSLFLALFLALGLDPAVRQLQRVGMKRPWAIVTVAVAVLAVVVAIVLLIVPAMVRQFVHIVETAPEWLAHAQTTDWYQSIENALGVDLESVIADGLASIANLSSFLAISGGVLKAAGGVVASISSTVLVVVLTLYFIASLETMKRSLAMLVPQYRRATFSSLTDQITASVGGFVAGGLTLSSINAAVVFVLQLLIGSNIAVLLAIGAFFITLVPMVGSMIFLVVGTVAALFIGPWPAVIFLIGYFAYIQIEAYFVTPRVMGKAVAVPGVLVIIGAMTGAALMGLLGALVAIPITASVLIIIRQVTIPAQDAKTIAPDVG